MPTVEALLTTAVKRFDDPIRDVADTRAPRSVREGNQRLRHSKCMSALLLDSDSEEREPVMRRQSKPRKDIEPLKKSQWSRAFPVIT
jgi:hypothetical protein